MSLCVINKISFYTDVHNIKEKITREMHVKAILVFKYVFP